MDAVKFIEERNRMCGTMTLRRDLTTEECYVARQGGFFAHGRTLAKAMEALREKLFEDMTAESRLPNRSALPDG